MEMAGRFYSIACIPAFNEAPTIGQVVAQTRKFVDNVFVIDDGSNDQTPLIAKAAGATVVRHDKNKGYGAALKTIFRTARIKGADVIVVIDGDGQHSPDEIPRVLEPILSGDADVVIGSRFAHGNRNSIPSIRKVGLAVLNVATRMLGPRILDSQSGFRAYSRNAVDVIDPYIDGMAAGSEILVQANRSHLKIVEVPTTCKYESEDSFQKQFLHGFDVLLSLVRLYLQSI